MYHDTELQKALVRSLLTVDNPWNTTEDVLAWIERRNRDVSVRIEHVPFRDLKGWRFDETSGNLCHDSGRFFSIVGLDVSANTGSERRWTQPVINQPEVGYLGILCREVEGVLYFLLQAKIEPGNVNSVQLSPTLQATRSNYTQVHGGRCPEYLDYFKNATPDQVVLDQLQSEQGARFYRKRNRNMVVLIRESLEPKDDFRWLTLGQIRQLMRFDNVVNMDTRTVLSGLRFSGVPHEIVPSDFGREMFVSEASRVGVHTIDGILHRISLLKSRYELVAEKIPLRDVRDWRVTDSEISRPDGMFFRVLGVNVTISNREVSSWCQPLVQPMQEGLCVLFMKRIGGVLHVLVQAKVECGNFDVVEMAPTIQCLTGNYKTPVGYVPNFLEEFLSGSCIERIVFDTLQSEEGGRFYHEQNRNVVCLVNEEIPDVPPDNYIWLTLGQVKEFLRFNNYLNIQVRSLISALEYK